MGWAEGPGAADPGPVRNWKQFRLTGMRGFMGVMGRLAQQAQAGVWVWETVSKGWSP